MSWLDQLLGDNDAGVGGAWQPTAQELTWLASHGLNIATLTPQQKFLAKQQMDADFARENDASAATARAQAEAAARDAAARSAAEALARSQAEEEVRRVTAENEARATAESERIANERAEADRIRAEEEARRISAEQANIQRLGSLRSAAVTAGQSGARDYFTRRGVDATPYGSQIDELVNAALKNVSATEENPSKFIDPVSIGSGIYSSAESARRTALGNELNRLFPDSYGSTRIGSNVDDAIIDALYGEERGKAQSYVDNLLKRGVTTAAGADAASKNLDAQGAGVRTRLNAIGDDYITSARDKLTAVGNRGRQAASNVTLGGAFDTNSYTKEADQIFSDFMASLPNTIRARAPGNLFSTAGLGAIAGSAQGAQNTKFNPNALAGVLETESEEDKLNDNKSKSSQIDAYVF